MRISRKQRTENRKQKTQRERPAFRRTQEPSRWGAPLLFSVFCSLFTSVADAEQARSADAFVDSIGVCSHWGYGDTPYGFAYDKVKQKLAETGIRHVRDGFSDRIPDLAKLGIRTTVALDPELTPEQIRDKVKSYNANGIAIDAVEGPNEPDFFWDNGKHTYKGMGSTTGGQAGIMKGVTAFQRDLYAAMKADPATKNITVIGPSLGKTYGYDVKSPLGNNGELANAVDWGNFHPYPGGNPFTNPLPYGGLAKYTWQGNHPSNNIDENPFAFDIYAGAFKPKPMCATETGYSTDVNGSGVTEAVHAKYMPRLFCEYFRKGIQRAYSYEFADEFEDNDRTNREANFGLIRRDTTAKPAFTAIKNLIAILGEKDVSPSFKPGNFDFKLEVSPAGIFDRTQYVHHLLLQKSTGDYYLVLWHEVSAEDTSAKPHRQIAVPELPATLTFNAPPRRIVYFVPNESDQPLNTFKNLPLVHLKIPDRVVILQITPAAR